MNTKNLIISETFQSAWIKGVEQIINSGWEISNLVINIKKPVLFDHRIHEKIEKFCRSNRLIGPKHVAYTIFPHNLYRKNKTATNLFTAYNRQRGLYKRLRSHSHSGWGTYFRRMTHYETKYGDVNQLKNIIDAINKRHNLYKAAYTIIIQKPGGETARPLGGPCLNYIAVQLNSKKTELGLLCIYRNHDFLERAYGNYWGLCNLIRFLAHETKLGIGPLTVISSHAYIPTKKRNLQSLILELNEIP